MPWRTWIPPSTRRRATSVPDRLGDARSGSSVPLIRPGVFAGATIVFIWSFTELGTPLMFEFETVTPVQIFHGIQEMEASSRPYALTAVMLISVARCYLLGRWVFGGRGYAMYSKASRAARPIGSRVAGPARIGRCSP